MRLSEVDSVSFFGKIGAKEKPLPICDFRYGVSPFVSPGYTIALRLYVVIVTNMADDRDAPEQFPRGLGLTVFAGYLAVGDAVGQGTAVGDKVKTLNRVGAPEKDLWVNTMLRPGCCT